MDRKGTIDEVSKALIDDVITIPGRWCGKTLEVTCLLGEGIRHRGGQSLLEAILWNVRTWSIDVNGEVQVGTPRRARVRKRCTGAESPVVAKKSPIKGWSEGVLQWSQKQ